MSIFMEPHNQLIDSVFGGKCRDTPKGELHIRGVTLKLWIRLSAHKGSCTETLVKTKDSPNSSIRHPTAPSVIQQLHLSPNSSIRHPTAPSISQQLHPSPNSSIRHPTAPSVTQH